jgi:hypothetical protein
MSSNSSQTSQSSPLLDTTLHTTKENTTIALKFGFSTSYPKVFVWHHMSRASFAVAALFCKAGLKENNGALEPPGVVGVDGVLGDGELEIFRVFHLIISTHSSTFT